MLFLGSKLMYTNACILTYISCLEIRKQSVVSLLLCLTLMHCTEHSAWGEFCEEIDLEIEKEKS